MSSSKTVLLTGFGPFPGVPRNASAALVRSLALKADRVFGQAAIVSAELPTVWREAPVMLEQLYFAHRPDIALHFGVSHMAHAMTIECYARNLAGRPDAAGDEPQLGLLTEYGPEELRVSIPTGRIVARLLRRGVPAVLSHDAGTYLCNALLYHSLELMRTLEIGGRCGFVHVPVGLPRQSRPSMRQGSNVLTFDDAVEGGLEILATLMNRQRRRPGMAASLSPMT